ncbi:hypothetical protein CRENBAI_007772 [Crenichthys baileyi]|uniref:Uncharacterized protein n=1 Tax=Crenichthys baileyi TaxID=28760 RepID=A0AAV9RLW5_9TELE
MLLIEPRAHTKPQQQNRLAPSRGDRPALQDMARVTTQTTTPAPCQAPFAPPAPAEAREPPEIPKDNTRETQHSRRPPSQRDLSLGEPRPWQAEESPSRTKTTEESFILKQQQFQ